MDPRVLFNMCRFLLMNMVDDDIPIGISKVRIIFAIAKLATTLGCYKLAREAFGKLNGFRIPKKFVDEVELASIHINGKPVTNNEVSFPS
jgi:intraflagellar transport protein 122